MTSNQVLLSLRERIQGRQQTRSSQHRSARDYGTVNGQPYLVMEFVDGESLARPGASAKWKRTMPWRDRDACIGLEEAQAGMIHRDIKPDNIMVTRDGG